MHNNLTGWNEKVSLSAASFISYYIYYVIWGGPLSEKIFRSVSTTLFWSIAIVLLIVINIFFFLIILFPIFIRTLRLLFCNKYINLKLKYEKKSSAVILYLGTDLRIYWRRSCAKSRCSTTNRDNTGDRVCCTCSTRGTASRRTSSPTSIGPRILTPTSFRRLFSRPVGARTQHKYTDENKKTRTWKTAVNGIVTYVIESLRPANAASGS